MPADLQVLLIEDDPAQARHVAALLGTLGFPGIVLESVGGLADASERLAGHPPDVILLDLALSEAPGLDGLLRVSAESSAPIVVLAGNRQCELGERALRHGAHALLQKDQLDPATLLRALERASATHSWILGPSVAMAGDGEPALEPACLLSQIECSKHATLGLTLDGVITKWNLGAERLCRRAATEVVGRPIASLVPLERRTEWVGLLERIRQGESFVHRETAILRKDGEPLDVMLLAAPARNPEGGTAGVFAIAWDITPRKRTEEALRRSEASSRALIESLPFGVLRADRHGTIVGANPALATMLGHASPTELVGLHLREIYQDPGECRNVAEQPRGGLLDAELHWKRQDGSLLTVRCEWRSRVGARDEPCFYEAIVEDVTERHTAEKKLHQAQKMEAVGRLAGGLAHDFNNMLGVIIGYSDLLLDQIALGDPSRGQLQEIRKAGDRAASLARQFLAFSREESPEPRILSLNTVVTDLERMLRRLIREDIELHTFLAPSVGQIKSDLGQLEQVIINLVVNARDAMPHGGKLILETFNVDLNEIYALHHPLLVPGPYVCLAVADTGVGMSAETQEHIFEPFFTTKPKDHGTGLGLATVYGVVKKNNGYVWVYSEPGMGATFKVYLPRVGDLAELSSGACQAAAMPLRSETILLVEDEPALRTVTSAMLERGGYFVLEAANAAEAMAVAGEHAGQIDLLLTDVIMPGMNGPALAAKMARARPQMKVLFISGYTGSYVAHRGLIEESSLLLQKPFTPEALLRKLQEILESPHRVEAVLETEAHRG